MVIFTRIALCIYVLMALTMTVFLTWVALFAPEIDLFEGESSSHPILDMLWPIGFTSGCAALVAFGLWSSFRKATPRRANESE